MKGSLRSVAILSVACSLSACAPRLSLLPSLSGHGAKPLETPAPAVICTASMTAEIPSRPPLPANAGFPKPTTPDGSAAVSTYLGWLREVRITFDLLSDRARETKAFCEANKINRSK